MNKHELGKLLGNEAILKGDFTLSSGIKSDTYVDKFKFFQPKVFNSILDQLDQLHNPRKFKAYCGTGLAGAILTGALSLRHESPLIIIRKEKKDHGTQTWLEGLTYTGLQCIFVEDVITTGETTSKCLKLLEENGIQVKQILCVVNRGEITRIGNILCEHIFTLGDLLKY